MFSAVIIAKNEQRTIQECILALKRVSDDIIVVLDDRSDDQTESICLRYGVSVVKKEWKGFSENKNYGIKLSKHNWVFCLDADEILNETLIQSLQRLQPKEGTYYLMNILTYFGDKPVRYCGWYPDWNCRLFNKDEGKWNGAAVHEKLLFNKPMRKEKLDGEILHRSFASEKHMEEKYDYYAQMRAKEWIRKEKAPSIMKRYFGPAFRFFKTYIIKLGILDGKVGYTIANQEWKMKRKEIAYYDKMKHVQIG